MEKNKPISTYEFVHQVFLMKSHKKKAFENLKKSEYWRKKQHNEYQKMSKESLLQTIGVLKEDIKDLEHRIIKIIEHLVLAEEKYLEINIQDYSNYKQKFENSKPFKKSESFDFDIKNQFKRANEI